MSATTTGSLQRLAIVVGGRPETLAGAEAVLHPQLRLQRVNSTEALSPLLRQGGVDVVILDLDGGFEPPLHFLDRVSDLRRSDPNLIVLAITQSQQREIRWKAAEVRADEFLVPPVDLNALKLILERALEKRDVEIGRRLGQKSVSHSFGELIGVSEAMLRVYNTMLRVAPSNTTVIIRGESGTGKELVARSIVALSERRERPFISLNCAALPENLIEAELFGHERGAYTGAHVSRAGQIELADGGTLFLDEIGTLGLELQSKLLRVLEDRRVQRLGGKSHKKIDFRLLTATNENLEEAVRAGRFREDLYYRINVVPISLPPLRERAGDIPLLADHFLRLYCAANRLPLKRLHPEVVQIFEEYTWRGNIRELENLIQRLVLMVEGTVIKAEDLPEQLLYASTTSQEAMLIPSEGIKFDEEIARIETAYLQAALRRTGGKKVAAAALLGINRQKMKYLCRKYGIGSGQE